MLEREMLTIIRQRIPDHLIFNVETGDTIRGFLDLIVVNPEAIVVFTELKHIPNKAEAIPYRPGQVPMINRLNSQGANTMLILTIGRTFYVWVGSKIPSRHFDENYIWSGDEWEIKPFLFSGLAS